MDYAGHVWMQGAMALRMPPSCKGFSSSAQKRVRTAQSDKNVARLAKFALHCPCSSAISSSTSHRVLVLTNTRPWHLNAAAEVSSQPLEISDAPLATSTSLRSYEDPYTFVPEDYELPAGVLSSVDRTSPASPEDAYRCIGCTSPECQVSVKRRR